MPGVCIFSDWPYICTWFDCHVILSAVVVSSLLHPDPSFVRRMRQAQVKRETGRWSSQLSAVRMKPNASAAKMSTIPPRSLKRGGIVSRVSILPTADHIGVAIFMLDCNVASVSGGCLSQAVKRVQFFLVLHRARGIFQVDHIMQRAYESS